MERQISYPEGINRGEQDQLRNAHLNMLDWKRCGEPVEFTQIIPADSSSVKAALKSQKITSAIHTKNPNKAFWVSAKGGAHEKQQTAKHTKMVYTFTKDGARSLFEDNLLCQSGGDRIGEADYPKWTLWKTTEEGARGIGATRLKDLEDSCKKIQAFDNKGKEIKA